METVRMKYLGDLRTEAIHIQSGEKLLSDAPLDNNGKGEYFSPTDLLVTSLGNCILTTMAISANAHSINFLNASLKITKIMVKNPRKVGEVIIDINMGDKDFSEKEKQILEKAGLTCPVALSLHPDVIQTIYFNYAVSVHK